MPLHGSSNRLAFWASRGLIGLGLTFLFTSILVVLASLQFMSDVVETLLSPGAYTARWIYGGLHGGEPLLLLLLTNTLFYWGIVLLIMFFRDHGYEKGK